MRRGDIQLANDTKKRAIQEANIISYFLTVGLSRLFSIPFSEISTRHVWCFLRMSVSKVLTPTNKKVLRKFPVDCKHTNLLRIF
jgi:hypothetical protein